MYTFVYIILTFILCILLLCYIINVCLDESYIFLFFVLMNNLHDTMSGCHASHIISSFIPVKCCMSSNPFFCYKKLLILKNPSGLRIFFHILFRDDVWVSHDTPFMNVESSITEWVWYSTEFFCNLLMQK